MHIYFCSNGLGTDGGKFQKDLEHVTGKKFIPLKWQKKDKKYNLQQRVTDYFDERDYFSEIIKPLVEFVKSKINKKSKLFFISHSTGSLIVEDIIRELNIKNTHHLLLAPAIKGSNLIDALEKGILIGKLLFLLAY